MKPNMIKGSFGNKTIITKLIKKKQSKSLVIFFHGVFSSTLRDKYESIAQEIIKRTRANCLLFESSRSMSYGDYVKSKISFEQYEKTFKGKTFSDELKDIRSVFNFYKTRYKAFHFVGISLGAVLASYLLPTNKNIKSFTILGSSPIINLKDKPIISSLDNPNKIYKNFSTHNGFLSIVHGSKDDLIKESDSRRIIKHAVNSVYKEFINMYEVDHRFIVLNKKNKESFLTKIITNTIIRNIVVTEDNQITK